MNRIISNPENEPEAQNLSVSQTDRRQSGRKRRVQARTLVSRERIEGAALVAFSEAGFHGASTRDIASRAGVTQQLVTYHYSSKLDLWKAAAERGFGELQTRLAGRLEGLGDVDESTRAGLLLGDFIRFSADHPEMPRFMLQEGGCPGERLHWLVDNHVRPMFEGLRDQLQRLQATGAAVAGNPALLTFMAMTAAGLFAQAAEFELLSGRDPRSPEVVEEYADLLGSILIPGATPSEP